MRLKISSLLSAPCSAHLMSLGNSRLHQHVYIKIFKVTYRNLNQIKLSFNYFSNLTFVR